MCQVHRAAAEGESAGRDGGQPRRLRLGSLPLAQRARSRAAETTARGLSNKHPIKFTSPHFLSSTSKCQTVLVFSIIYFDLVALFIHDAFHCYHLLLYFVFIA